VSPGVIYLPGDPTEFTAPTPSPQKKPKLPDGADTSMKKQ